RALWTGPVTIASSSSRRASVTASSSAAAAARAVSAVGSPNVQLGYLPMIWYSAEFASRSDFRASSTISGPIPAQSPSVIPMRDCLLFVLMLEFCVRYSDCYVFFHGASRQGKQVVLLSERRCPYCARSLPLCTAGVEISASIYRMPHQEER